MNKLLRNLLIIVIILATVDLKAAWRIECNSLPLLSRDYQNYKLNLHQITVTWPEIPSLSGYHLYWGPGAAYFTEMSDVGTATSAAIFVPANRRYFFCIVPYDSNKIENNCVALFDTLVPANTLLTWQAISYSDNMLKVAFGRNTREGLTEISVIKIDSVYTPIFYFSIEDTALTIPIINSRQSYRVQVSVFIVGQVAAGLDAVITIAGSSALEPPANLHFLKGF